MLEALKFYDEAIKVLTDINRTNILSEFTENIKKRLIFINNAAAHLRTHLQARTKFQAASYKFYMEADALVSKAIALDEIQKVNEAICVYGEAAVYFKKAADGVYIFTFIEEQ